MNEPRDTASCDLCGIDHPPCDMDMYLDKESGEETFECTDTHDCSLRRIANALEYIADLYAGVVPCVDCELEEPDKECMN